tara:strand:+ start:119 stop:241 length:123 start_codon:yes stop_codon:yes gene_type:complete
MIEFIMSPEARILALALLYVLLVQSAPAGFKTAQSWRRSR